MKIDYDVMCNKIVIWFEAYNQIKKSTVKRINLLFDSYTKEILFLMNNDIDTYVLFIDKLLCEKNIALQYVGATYAFQSNYRVSTALKIYEELVKQDQYVVLKISVGMFLNMYHGKYGTWERNNQLPNLEDYNK